MCYAKTNPGIDDKGFARVSLRQERHIFEEDLCLYPSNTRNFGVGLKKILNKIDKYCNFSNHNANT